VTKWHGSEEGARRHRRRDIWRPLGGILGSILGAFGAPFGHILGVRSALGRKCLIKGGVVFWRRRFLLIFERKMQILGPEKGSQIGPKRALKKVGKKDTSKNEIFTFFIINLMKEKLYLSSLSLENYLYCLEKIVLS